MVPDDIRNDIDQLSEAVDTLTAPENKEISSQVSALIGTLRQAAEVTRKGNVAYEYGNH
jgi:hypothetical protein